MSDYFTVPNTLDGLLQFLQGPMNVGRPTPLYWWSRADIERDVLTTHLDELSAHGVGGTIVGYSHLADGRLDYGNPAPLSKEWWDLFGWFVRQSASRGLVVGIQDYGIIGPVLDKAGSLTTGHNPGTLSETHTYLRAGESLVLTQRIANAISARVWPEAGDPRIDGWQIAVGEQFTADRDLHASIVVRTPGALGLSTTKFDPLHPNSGAAVIAEFYEKFAEHLGELLGDSMIIFFQDELDLAIQMPMWNDDVSRALTNLGYDSTWIHALFRDFGSEGSTFRVAYRDTVVGLLNDHYFRPVYEWHEQHGTLLVMDQLSRGDLRLGRKHYADFLETMRWYHGPGNDDPDLTGERNVLGFEVSASIAHIHNRPVVVNEAFHSSGWGVAPQDILLGANTGFAAGSNHVMLHALYYSTFRGWWEWASPDFHFRQPWWDHSKPMWDYFARTGATLRAGHDRSPIALIDPVADLDVVGLDSASTETVQALIVTLNAAGFAVDLVSQVSVSSGQVEGGTLVVGSSRYSTVILPAMSFLRTSTGAVLTAMADDGGCVFVIGPDPQLDEHGEHPHRPQTWWRGDLDSLILTLAQSYDGFRINEPGVLSNHRVLLDADIHFFLNTTSAPIVSQATFPSMKSVCLLDLWSGQVSRAKLVDPTENGSIVELRLPPGEPVAVIVSSCTSLRGSFTAPAPATSSVALAGPWRVCVATASEPSELPRGATVETWRIETAAAPTGPWEAGLVGHGARMRVLGPVSPESRHEVENALMSAGLVESLSWRPYRFSLETGIEADSYLRDRMTGPHGLKGVPDEFLDPRAVDENPVPESYYYFESAFRSAGINTVRVASRADHAVWIGNRLCVSASETPAQFYPPWGLRDMRTVEHSTREVSAASSETLLVRVKVSVDQPTRAAVIVGGRPPAEARLDRLRWWDGNDPALIPEVPQLGAACVFVRARIPVGAHQATVEAAGSIIRAHAEGKELRVLSEVGTTGIAGEPAVLSSIAVGGAEGEMILEVSPLRSTPVDSGVLVAPVRWEVSECIRELDSWIRWGLSDFSGKVVYNTEFFVPEASQRIWLRLEGLLGSASVQVNGTQVGFILSGDQRVELTSNLMAGQNDLTIDCRNTLANSYSRLPSPYSSMQEPGGGFTAAFLENATLPDDTSEVISPEFH